MANLTQTRHGSGFSASGLGVTLTVRTDAHADGFGDCPKQTGPPYPEQRHGHGMVGSIDSESCWNWARVRLLFFEWNEVHSSPLLKHDNEFYRVKKGDLFLKPCSARSTTVH